LASQISIAVTLDDKGVVTGVKSIEGGLQKIGQTGNVVFTGMSKQQKEAREAAIAFSQATGIQIPGALDKIFAKIPGLSGALAGLFKTAGVLLFFSAVVQGVNHFDELKVKIREAGFELALFGDHIRQAFGFGDQSIIIGEQVKKEQALMKPLFDLQQQAADKAALAAKTGFSAIAEQGKQSIKSIKDTASAQLDAAQKQITDQKDLGRVQAMIAGQTEAAIVAAKKETAAQASALFREQMNAAKKEADDLTLINLDGAGKILQQEKNKFAEIDRLEKQGSVSSKVAQAQRVNATFEANQQIYKLYQDYREQTDKMNDDTVISTAKGFDQIATEAARRKDEAEHEFDKLFGSLDEKDNRRVAGEKALQDRLTDIDRDRGAAAARSDPAEHGRDHPAAGEVRRSRHCQHGRAPLRRSSTDYSDAIRAIDQNLARSHHHRGRRAKKARGSLEGHQCQAGRRA
jgi:hypothetical protein